MSALKAPLPDPQPFPSVPSTEECKKKARHRAMEDYGYRSDVYDMLFRYLNDLLTTQPKDSLDFMMKWAATEMKNPNKMGPPLKVDLSKERYNLRVDLTNKEQDVRAKKDKAKRA